ncbi:MAG: hypothetical protein ACLGIN_17100 [Candidatus Sericytochromatia bacterium]
MMTKTKIHYLRADDWKTACGAPARLTNATTDLLGVTCKRCVQLKLSVRTATPEELEDETRRHRAAKEAANDDRA